MATAIKVFVPSVKLPASAVPEKLKGPVEKLRSNTDPLKSLDVRHAAICIGGRNLDGDSGGVAKGGVINRVCDGYTGRYIGNADCDIHDGGCGGETSVIRGDSRERVAPDGDGGRDGIRRLADLAKET